MTNELSPKNFDSHRRKPIAYANRSFDYFKLNDKEFEEIVYEIYDQEIEFGSWSVKYDCINWLRKVGERGRDCTLHKNGNNVGVIQCKHSEKNTFQFSKAECAKEIIKFLLHSLIDDKLIYKIETFRYYLIVSSHFKEDAFVLLNNFKKQIYKESDLEKWVKSVLYKNKKLFASFTQEQALHGLNKVFLNFNVITVVSTDLDLHLLKDFNSNIREKHFEHRTLNNPVLPSKLSIKDILKNLEDASFHLHEYKDSFEGLPDSHIDRKETKNLREWLKKPLEKKR